jgi:hypothetical protein
MRIESPNERLRKSKAAILRVVESLIERMHPSKAFSMHARY